MSLDRLRAHLDSAVRERWEDGRPAGNADAMAKAVRTIRTRVDGASQAAAQTDRVRSALALLYQEGPERALATHPRYVCWGLLTPMPQGVLLSNRRLFRPTLKGIERLFERKALTTNAWRGLLGGYLGAPPTMMAEAEENWTELRGFLASSLPVLESRVRVQPAWLSVLGSGRALLGDQPCAPYAEAMLTGHAEAVEQLRDTLMIPMESWFWERLLLAQAREAARLVDKPFLEVLDRLLPHVGKNPRIVNEALAVLLSRYAASLSSRPHEDLKALALAQWGSPNLHSQAKWALVEPPVKSMVREWLVREDLIDFFEILKEEKETDGRRLAFWMRYYKQMEYAHLAFGSGVYNSTNRAVVDLLSKKKGRYCRLIGSGSRNNAIIMKLGGHFFVEFSQTGNACYGYNQDLVPFDLRKSEQHIHALKSVPNAFQESHVDSSMKSWEDKYGERLRDFGIFPDQVAKPAVRQPVASKLVNATSRPVSPPGAGVPAWEREFLEVRQRYGLRIEDHRKNGGNLWALHLRDDDRIARDLKEIGFRFVAQRGWWRK